MSVSSMTFVNVHVGVSVTIGQPVTDAYLCEVYESSSIGKCSVDYTCTVTDGRAGCQ